MCVQWTVNLQSFSSSLANLSTSNLHGLFSTMTISFFKLSLEIFRALPGYEHTAHIYRHTGMHGNTKLSIHLPTGPLHSPIIYTCQYGSQQPLQAHARIWHQYAYMSVYMCCMFITWKCKEDFTGSTQKGNGRHGNQVLEVTRLVNDEENDCRFEVQREEPWIHTRHTWSIAVRERLLELFCD